MLIMKDGKDGRDRNVIFVFGKGTRGWRGNETRHVLRIYYVLKFNEGVSLKTR